MLPKNNNSIKLLPIFLELNIDTINLAPAPKFLLKSLKSIKRDKNNSFIYKDLIDFMIKNKNNTNYYKGNSDLKTINIKRYWQYACSDKHKSGIPNFKNFYLL